MMSFFRYWYRAQEGLFDLQLLSTKRWGTTQQFECWISSSSRDEADVGDM